MPRIENKTFDEIRLGDTASLVRTLTHKDIEVRRQSAGFASALCQLALFAGIPAAFWLHGDAEP